MYLSAQEIARSRDHTLNNLLNLSTACIDAGKRLSEALATTGRETVHHGSKQATLFSHGQLESLTQFPTGLWLDNASRSSRLFEMACDILGETQKTLIHATELQIRVVDEMIFAGLNRAAKAAPWEASIAIATWRNSLASAETTLHEVSNAAIETVELAEQEASEISRQVDEHLSPRRRPATRPRTTSK